jgi:diguanylate cyclase
MDLSQPVAARPPYPLGSRAARRARATGPAKSRCGPLPLSGPQPWHVRVGTEPRPPSSLRACPVYVETSDKAHACASAAIASIAECGLEVDPQNFSVWYEYHSGRNPDLARIIDLYRSNRRSIDDKLLTDLYDRFFGLSQESRAIRDVSARMQQTLQQVQALVADAGQDARRFGAAVRDASGQLESHGCTISELIQRVLGEAREVAERSQHLELQLRQKNEKLRAMEQTLSETRREAITDSLTGLANRRHFDQSLQLMAGEAMNDGKELSLLLVDIDHFKRINDTWGHQVGDQVLQLLAATLRGQLREHDLAARYGGEEFGILLPDTRVTDATLVANRLREAFERREMVAREGRQTIGRITLSVGLARYEPGEALSEWVCRADTALYEAKQTGRNRVVVARAAT